MDNAVKVPLSERVNWRMILFAGLVVLLIVLPVYNFLELKFTGGIKDHGEYVEVDLMSMSTFPFDQVNGTIEDVPEQWRKLDGRRVVLVGEMYEPDNAAGGVQNFQLVYSIANCCFTGTPQIQHFVHSKAAKEPLPYYQGLVRVVGTLHVDVKQEGGRVTSVYQLDVESVEPA